MAASAIEVVAVDVNYSRLMKEFNSSFPFYFVNSVEVTEKSKLVICFYFRKCNFVV